MFLQCVDAKLTSEKLWQTVFTPSSFVFSFALDKVADEDVIALAQLLVVLTQRKLIPENCHDCFVELLLRILSHSSWRVRRETRHCVFEMHLSDSSLSRAMLDQLLFARNDSSAVCIINLAMIM